MALLVLRSALAALLLLAAAGKLADLPRFRRTLADFGGPPLLAPAVPLAELAAAGLLVPSATARAGAGLAAVLLAAFTAAVGRALRRPVRPPCGCFGADETPVSGATVARNAVLVGAAGAVLLAGPGRSLGAVGVPPLAAVAAVAVAGQAWFSWQLLRQHGRLLLRVRALEARAQPAPPALTVVRSEAARG